MKAKAEQGVGKPPGSLGILISYETGSRYYIDQTEGIERMIICEDVVATIRSLIPLRY